MLLVLRSISPWTIFSFAANKLLQAKLVREVVFIDVNVPVEPDNSSKLFE